MGASKTLTAQVLPVGAPQAVVWSTSDDTVAKVSASGAVSGHKAGTADITATASNGVSSSCKVTVKADPLIPTKITANPTSVKLAMGGTSQVVQYTVEPATATQKVRIIYRDTIMGTSLTNDDTGVNLRPMSVGKGTLKVAVVGHDDVSVTIPVEVVQPVTGVEFSRTQPVELEVGGTYTLTVNVLPEDATNKNVTYQIKDPTIVKMGGSTGRTVQGLKEGSTEITATTEDGGFKTSLGFVVTVKAG